MDRTVTDLVAGTKRATMVTSLRWPPAFALVAEGLDLGRVVDEGAAVGAHQQDVERLARRRAALTRCLEWTFLIWSKR